jgi:WD40 repeat protein
VCNREEAARFGTPYRHLAPIHRSISHDEIHVRLPPVPTIAPQHGKRLSNVAFSPDGKYLAAAGFDPTAKVWEVASGREVLSVAQRDQLRVLAFSPGGKMLYTASGYNLDDYFGTGSREPGVNVWSIAERTQVAHLAHPGSVTAFSFFPGGARIATAGQDGTVRVWMAPYGGQQSHIVCETSVNSMDISPDGRRIATGTVNRVAVWNAEGGALSLEERTARL